LLIVVHPGLINAIKAIIVKKIEKNSRETGTSGNILIE